MKKLKDNKTVSLVMAAVFALASFAGCFGGGTSEGSSAGGSFDSGYGSEVGDSSDSGQNGKEDNVISIEKGDSGNPSYGFQNDGELTVSSVSKQSTINKLQATDDYGRSVDYIDGKKTDKERYVGLFYFTWLGWHGNQMNGVYDISKLMDEDPISLWSTVDNSVSPIGQYHFWGEPLYGYYNSKDPWVIRKQIELFTMSGIDFIAFDCTNAFDYIDVVSVILPILQEYYDAGWDVPKFMFYLNSNSGDVIERLYSGRPTASDNELEKYGIYKKGYYKDLWCAPNGKPKIVAITELSSTCGEGTGNNHVTNAEILDFFDFWESTWPNNTQWTQNGLAWMDWNKPEQLVLGQSDGGTINVSVAQHNKLPFSDALLSEELADKMYGRGYTSTNGADHSDDAIDSGLNFEEEWSVAIQKDVKYTFVTGWNEWIAIKSVGNLGMNSQYVSGKRVYFVDTVNREYSRDIELMKGGYADNAYLALMRNTRTYKGKQGVLAASPMWAIDISKGLTQWNNVTDVYYNMGGEINRNFKNFSNTETYVDNSLRNDIEEIRVTHDDKYLYFLVKCADDIKIDIEAENWMNLLIDVEGQDERSFYGYDYMVNRISSYTGKCSVDKLAYKNGKLSYELANTANFTVNGKYMQYKVSKKALGIDGSFKINFKIADNVADPADISSYYITGEAAPVGRLNYTFKG